MGPRWIRSISTLITSAIDARWRLKSAELYVSIGAPWPPLTQPGNATPRTMPSRIRETAVWLAAAQLIQTVATLLVPIVLVRQVSVQEYGLYRQIDLIASLIVPLLLVGLDTSTTYFVPRTRGNKAAEISTPMVAVTTTSFLFLLLSVGFPSIFEKLFGWSEPPLLLLAVTLATAAVAQSELATRALLALDEGKTAALAPLFATLPRSLTLVAVALIWGSLAAVLWTIIVFAVIEIALYFVLVARKGGLTGKLDFSVLRRHLGYGGKLGLIGFVKSWGLRVDRYLVSTVLGPASFAVYSVGKTRIPFARILPSAISNASAPRFSSLEAEGRYEDMAALWRKRGEALLPLQFLLAMMLCVTAQWSIPLVFTDTYADAIPVFRVYAFTLVVQSLGGVDLILRALAAIRFLSIVVGVVVVLRIVACLAALQLDSLAFLAATQMVITFASLGVQLTYSRSRLGVDWKVLLPRRGLVLSLAISVVGVAWTFAVASKLGDNPLMALGASLPVWGLAAVFVAWKQGLTSGWKRSV